MSIPLKGVLLLVVGKRKKIELSNFRSLSVGKSEGTMRANNFTN